MNLKFLAPLGVLVASSSFAQSSGGMHFGPTGGIYIPTDTKIRDLFGSGFRFSLAPTTSELPTELKWLPAFSAISDSKDGNKFFLLPITASYVRHLSHDPNIPVIPYVKFTVGPSYYDYAVTINAKRIAKKTVGYTAGLEFGAKVSKVITAYAKYNYFSKSDDLDFSGISLGVELNLFKF
jgi:hypothetical protein